MECEFDRAARHWKTRWFNCDNGDARAVEHRIKQISSELLTGRGLTNREKRELNRERNFLQRQFTQRDAPHSRLGDPLRMKAAEKQLGRLARKVDAKK